MIKRALSLFAFLMTVSTCVASNETRIFWAGFGEVKDRPQTAPSVSQETQPVSGPVTLDFNDLKDPKITPDFQLRKEFKDQIPGFSRCNVNWAGKMTIALDAEKKCIRMTGDNPKVEGYIGRRFFKSEPTRVEVTVERVAPAEDGKIALRICDIVSGAYVLIASLNGNDSQNSWGISYNTTDRWSDWKGWFGPMGVDWSKPVKVSIGKITPTTFRIFINGKPVGEAIKLPELTHLTEFTLTAEARQQGVKVLEVSAWRDENLIRADESVLPVLIQTKDKKQFIPTNPYGTGVQAAYPERGFADAMNEPALFDELATVLRGMHTKLIRFPGGNWTYHYSIHGPESMDAIKKVNDAYILDRNVFGWSDTKRFFELCKTIGSDAIYEFNLRFVYDPKAKEAYAIDEKTLPLALADAKQIVRWSQEVGVKVFWEFGNEDYCFFEPADYVKRCKEFFDAVKDVDPKAPFIICGDGLSWSDWKWAMEVFEGMKKVGLTDIACISNHVYLHGGAGIAFVDGQHTYDGILAAWSNLKYLHRGLRDKLDSLGYTQTKEAITEGNIAAPPCPIIGEEWEHGMGRSLAEATVFPERIQQYAMLVHHDLVRNDEPGKAGTWFSRIDYYPNNPKGKRYGLPLDAEVMKVVHEHALREIVFNRAGITASQWTDGVLVTACNPLGIEKKVKVQIKSDFRQTNDIEVTCLASENLDTKKFTVKKVTVKPIRSNGGMTIEVTLPEYSFGYFRVTKPEK